MRIGAVRLWAVWALWTPSALCSWGCGLIGPSCLDRQQRGSVTALDGEIAPGQIASHQVPYGTEGSQNDVNIVWPDQTTRAGPRISVYATKTDCVEFLPPGSGACAPIGSRGGTTGADGEFVQNRLIVTNGRGNPDILGSPAEYKLWVVGDPERMVRYSINITWFYGPDC
jgi:hypothetical protein